jgi:pyrimidine operon attenuation protein/uracil phosphoribosyltransferase
MTTSPKTVSAADISQLSVAELCAQLSQAVASRYSQASPVIVGIHRGGFAVAEWLHEQLGAEEPVGALDISWHRDDLKASSISPHVKPTRLPVDIDGREVLLVDEILFTGRTIRAAMNELFDYGRPSAVRLAVLGQRSGKELPIAADFVGAEFELAGAQRIKLNAETADVNTWNLELQHGQ